VWVHVLSFVDDAETIARAVGLVSHAFHALAAEPQLWRRLVLRSLALAAADSVIADDFVTAGDDSAYFCADDATDAIDTDSGGGTTMAANLYEGDPDGWRKSYFARRWLARSVRTRTRAHVHSPVRGRF
jgi:hypothetical protein